jgi:hypothetical protein
MISRSAGPLLSMLLLLGTIGCAKKTSDEECVHRLSASIKVGAPEADVERSLDQCGFSHSLDQRSGTIFAIKRGEKTGVTQDNWSMQVKLDDQHNVSSVKVEKVFTGP